MTGNTKGLDEILNAVTNFTYDAMAHPGDPLVGTLPTMNKATAKQALLDWHNKQTEELLDRLENQSRRADDCTDDTLVVKMIRVGAERERLNSSKSTPFNKLKESK